MSDQLCNIRVKSRQSAVECCKLSATLAGKLGQPGIGDLPVAGQPVMADILICDGFGPLNKRETEARVSDCISGWHRLDQGYGIADQALKPGGGGGIQLLQGLINFEG